MKNILFLGLLLALLNPANAEAQTQSAKSSKDSMVTLGKYSKGAITIDEFIKDPVLHSLNKQIEISKFKIIYLSPKQDAIINRMDGNKITDEMLSKIKTSPKGTRILFDSIVVLKNKSYYVANPFVLTIK